MKAKTAIMAVMAALLFVAFSSPAFAGDCCCFCFPDWCCYKCIPRQDFGKAFNSAVNNQILDPCAEENPTPVEGIDGRAAVNIMKGYINSFKQQAAPSGGGLTSFAVTQSPGGYTH